MAMLTLNGLVRTSTRSRPVLTAKQVKCGPSLCVRRSSAKTSWRAERRSSKWSR